MSWFEEGKIGVALTFVEFWVSKVPADHAPGKWPKEAKETAMRGSKKSSRSFFVNQGQGKGDSRKNRIVAFAMVGRCSGVN